MEDLILSTTIQQKNISKDCYFGMKTVENQNLEDLLRKNQFTMLCNFNFSFTKGFLKPLIFPTIKASLDELFYILLEFGTMKHVVLIFVFSEKASKIYQLLLKYNLSNKITYICDPSKKYFDSFQIKPIYKHCCEQQQRNTSIFIFQGKVFKDSVTFARKME
jgi:hypothetical protein